MDYHVAIQMWPLRAGTWEVVPDGWIWRGNTRLTIDDPRHIMRGNAREVHVGHVTLRDYQNGGPRDRYEFGSLPIPLAAQSPELMEEDLVDDLDDNSDEEEPMELSDEEEVDVPEDGYDADVDSEDGEDMDVDGGED